MVLTISNYMNNDFKIYYNYLQEKAGDEKLAGTLFEKNLPRILENEKSNPFFKDTLECHIYKDYLRTNDPGVDLICIQENGEILLIQVKLQGENQEITSNEVNKFLRGIAVANTEPFLKDKIIHYIYLTSTSEYPGRGVSETFSAKNIKLINLEELNNFSICWESATSQNKVISLSSQLSPENHQLELVSKLKESFKSKNSRSLVSSFCGTGKTYSMQLGFEAYSEHLDKKLVTIVATPTLLLLKKTLESWCKNFSEPHDFNYICVCSSKDVDQNNNLKPEDDANDLINKIPKVTSEMSDIKVFLDSKNQKHKVIFTTHTSALIKLKIINGLKVDYLIIDEAHRICNNGKRYEDLLIKTSHTTFCTATPKYINYTNRRNKETLSVSMDDKTFFGEMVYELDYNDALKKTNRLVPFKIIVHNVSTNHELLEKKCYSFDRMEEQLSAVTLIEVFNKHKDIKRIISFHSRVDYGEDFSSKLFEIQDKITDRVISLSENISSRKTLKKRARILDDLSNINSNEVGIVSNSRCLREGVDVKNLDAILFSSPMNSEIEIIQSIGRVCRSNNNKKLGYIIIPVRKENNIVLSDSWKAMHDTLDTILSIDKSFQVIINEHALNSNYSNSLDRNKSNESFIRNINQKVEFNNLSLSDTGELVEEIFSKSNTLFLKYFSELKDYIENNNKNYPPAKDSAGEDHYLYKFISRIRQRYTRAMDGLGQISDDHIEKMESLPHWSWSPSKDHILRKIEILRNFYSGNNENLPTSIENSTEYTILRDLRKKYREKKISKEHEKQLGPKLFLFVSMDTSPEGKWLKKAYELKDFYLDNDNRMPSHSNNKNLYTWLHKQASPEPYQRREQLVTILPAVEQYFEDLETKIELNIREEIYNLQDWLKKNEDFPLFEYTEHATQYNEMLTIFADYSNGNLTTDEKKILKEVFKNKITKPQIRVLLKTIETYKYLKNIDCERDLSVGKNSTQEEKEHARILTRLKGKRNRGEKINSIILDVLDYIPEWDAHKAAKGALTIKKLRQDKNISDDQRQRMYTRLKKQYDENQLAEEEIKKIKRYFPLLINKKSK